MVYLQKIKNSLALKLLLSFVWLVNLEKTDAYLSVYVLCTVVAVFCIVENRGKQRPFHAGMAAVAALFSLLVVLANYPLFLPFYALESKLNLLLCLGGGWVMAYETLVFSDRVLPLSCENAGGRKPWKVFLLSFSSIAILELAFLFFAGYPGTMTTDSFSTIEQINTGVYNNTMPFWHTLTVQLFYKLGLGLFGEVNAALATFHTFQCLFLSACFAYSVMTLAQLGLPGVWLCAITALYGLAPYNLVFASSLWKDVLFGGATLLLITAFYRTLWQLGSRRWNLLWLTVAAVNFSLQRTNGWYAFLVMTLILAMVLKKGERKLLILLGSVVLVCWVMINPLLTVLNVQHTDKSEALAVPFQQIARVIVNQRPLSPEDTELLEQVFYLDRVQEVYTPETVDPVKFEAFRRDQIPFAKAHMGQYLWLYIRLGFSYPVDYLQAWVEETKGFWNGGYAFWLYTRWIPKNTQGFLYQHGQGLIGRSFDAWIRWVEKPDFFQPFYSIGLYVWLTLFCFFLNIWKKRREWMLTIPLLVLLAGLWVGTPVYAEFRYAYPVFTSLPFLLGVTVFQKKSE